jgi:hypothetical protein
MQIIRGEIGGRLNIMDNIINSIIIIVALCVGVLIGYRLKNNVIYHEEIKPETKAKMKLNKPFVSTAINSIYINKNTGLLTYKKQFKKNDD